MKSSSKIFLYLFLAVFFISNTGLPLTIHLCQMMKESSLDECEICEIHKSVCCDDNYTYKITKSGIDNCCDTKIAAEPIKDKYLTPKVSEITVDLTVIDLIGFVYSDTFQNEFQPITFSSDSPPGKLSQEIFLLNSTFLI